MGPALGVLIGLCDGIGGVIACGCRSGTQIRYNCGSHAGRIYGTVQWRWVSNGRSYPRQEWCRSGKKTVQRDVKKGVGGEEDSGIRF